MGEMHANHACEMHAWEMHTYEMGDRGGVPGEWLKD
jgi:hypothetical protein